MADPVFESDQQALEPYSTPGELPLLTTREVVIYPLMTAPLLIEEEHAIRAVDGAMNAGHKTVALFGLRDEAKEKQGQYQWQETP